MRKSIYKPSKISHSKTSLSKSEERVALDVIKSGCISSGRVSKKFLGLFIDYLQEDNVLLYSSGSESLFNILNAIGINKNDEILVPNYICNSVLKCIIVAGAKPVLYDNSSENWVSSISEIEKYITKKTKSIIINHTYGIFNDSIKKLKEKNIFIIEDCCHLLISPSKDFPIMKYSDAAFFSFNATKLLATGEGGAVVTKDKNLFRELSKIKIDNPINDISASIGISQINKYSDFLKKRRDIANEYDVFFANYNLNKNIKKSIYFRYTIRVANETQKIFLNSNKVSFKKGVDDLLVFNLKMPEDTFINSYNDYLTTVSIPIYPVLKKTETKIILDEAKKILNAGY